ncbi:LLM class flavin-dependent oxidoreductase [Pseudonocardia kujensis]|uniref:LLM class flavin-dependent oxidoreductase n=1 Tax=Pseudonocardia kujensis TaxID=1128675 RepID=UPI001E45437B|nr:LLM class flavin-dependent oxidoreductase [Pseudonocardia kujensis]MCE0766027.1 LLM class flavin-dependent oxidoreductase [Pseudonocardia kujensis]
MTTPSTNPIFGPNRLKMGVFGLNGKGTANTLVPEVHTPTWEKNLRAAQLADAAGLEAIVAYARWKGHRVGHPDHPSGVVLEPFTWAAGIAQATRHAAVFATSHAPTVHPIAAAKMAATVDIISGGRFGLNVVAGWSRPELEMFGAPLKEHDERYAHLAEWLDIITRLWTEDHEFDHDGPFFQVAAAASRPRPVQRPRPAIMSAGSSQAGRAFALRNADMCFISLTSSDPDDWRAQVEAYKTAAREEFGRETQVWIMSTIVQRDTNAEADAALRRIAVDNADHESIQAWMDERAINSQALSTETREVLHLRAAAGAGGSIFCGDAERIAEQLQTISDVGIDGLLIGYVDFEDGLGRLGKDLLPVLEQRGLREPFAPLGAS